MILMFHLIVTPLYNMSKRYTSHGRNRR